MNTFFSVRKAYTLTTVMCSLYPSAVVVKLKVQPSIPLERGVIKLFIDSWHVRNLSRFSLLLLYGNLERRTVALRKYVVRGKDQIILLLVLWEVVVIPTKNSVIEHSIFLDYVLYQIVHYLKCLGKQAGKTFVFSYTKRRQKVIIRICSLTFIYNSLLFFGVKVLK